MAVTTGNLNSVSLTTVCLVVVSRLLRVNVPFVINGVTVPVGPSAVNRHGTFLHLFWKFMQLFHAAAVRALSLPLQLECSLTFVQLPHFELHL